MLKQVHFKSSALPYMLVAPQIIITLVFFMWPASQAIYQSLLIEDAFGMSSQFVWFDNFKELYEDDRYLKTFFRTLFYSAMVAMLSLSVSLVLAAMADRVIRGTGIYRTLLIWPYAVAPVIAGALWVFLFYPTTGIISTFLTSIGYEWNHQLKDNQAMFLVVVAAAWKQISYNFLFFLAGMQSIPKSLIEAAAIDAASPLKRFWTIIFPLITPTTFFLLVVNIVYAFFETFGIIHVVTKGGPANATEILVYKVYNDGFVGLDLGGSAAQSVILMILVIGMTIFQFKFIERKVEY
ncbi:MAG TPA: sn-glycerol-3-phosphate ABC transporter permease UgpA [Leucothrix sp.]|nr:sn-glycerol-3-phosphate ABC transporter permease UgpA [Leucothrix sp.]